MNTCSGLKNILTISVSAALESRPRSSTSVSYKAAVERPCEAVILCQYWTGEVLVTVNRIKLLAGHCLDATFSHHLGLPTEQFPTWQHPSLRNQGRESARKRKVTVLCNIITEVASSYLRCKLLALPTLGRKD